MKQKEDKAQEVHNELTHLLETLAIITSTPTHFVEPQILTIKERVKQIVHEAKEKSLVGMRRKQKLIAYPLIYNYYNNLITSRISLF